MTTFNACPPGVEQPPNKAPEEDSRLLKIKKLKTKLINEEHRLVLMKKIRQSQTRPIAANNNNNNNNLNNNQTNNNNNNQATTNQSGSNLNHSGSHHHSTSSSSSSNSQVKKLRPSHHLHQSSPMALQKSHQSGLVAAAAAAAAANLQSGGIGVPSASLNQTPAHAHQRPKVNTLWNPPQQARHPTPAGLAPAHVGNLSRPPITTPPNVVQAMMGSLTGQQSLLMNQISAATAAANAASRRPQQQQQSQHQTSLSPATPNSFNKSQAAQMLLQKRSSFKPSIQKQLEQTLMQQQQQLQQQQTQQQKHGQPSGLGSYGSTPNLNKRSVGITSPHVGNLSRPPITTPPNVVQDMRGGLAGQQSLLMNANNLSPAGGGSSSLRKPQQQQQSQLASSSTTFNKSQAAQLLLQKRTAAKSAIQKQLEQTLMQLPQKHVQVGIDFVPNANNIEFVYYIGLEACVDYLTNTKNPMDIQPLEKQFECSTCGTDFTPAWSWKRSNAVCENCVSNHVKKSIKNSQASRIKSVLIKAVKQEQEMEQRIMAEAATVVSTASPTTSTSQQHSLLQPTSHHQQHHNLQHQQHHHHHHHQQQPQQSHQPQQQHQPQRSTPQAWQPRINASPLNVANTNRSTHIQPPVVAPPNPLAGIQPAALASLLQMNPQLSTIASLMNPNNSNANTNQFAQVAALLQLTMNLTGNWKR